MSLYVKNRKQQKRSVRTWFGCDCCGMYGDCTTSTDEQADALLADMEAAHSCPPSREAVPA